MNIIELFEHAGIYTETLKAFTFEDTVKVKNQFETERAQNPNVEANLADNLILAINEFPRELLFISNNRILYNFFARKNYARNRFSSDNAVSVSVEQVKAFIEKFLAKDLETFFDENLAQNKFEIIDDFLSAKEYLPQTSLDSLSQKVSEKLDAVISKIDANPSLSNGTNGIEFLKYRSFYNLISQFSSKENDQKIKTIYDKMRSLIVLASVRNEFLNPMISAMSNYKAADYELARILQDNKDRIEAAAIKEEASSGGGGMSTWSIVVIIVVILRLILLMARLGRA
jgi:hypothetical protein